MTRIHSFAGAVAALALCLVSTPVVAVAQGRDFSDVEITAHHVAGSVYYLEGQGGNIGVSVGDDGIVMIDDQFAPITAKAIATILLPVLNFAGRRFLVFPSPKRGPWDAGQNFDPNR